MDKLKIDSNRVKQKLIRFIREQTSSAGFSRVVLGLSGGLDSSVTVYLCCAALGKDNVLGLILPYKISSAESINHAKLIARRCQVKTRFIDISEQIDTYFKNFSDADRIRRGNKMARERMSILYDQSKAWDALVVGTSNKTEILLGYGTIYGDVACAFNPLGSLYKTQLRQLAKDLGLPKEIIQKTPSAGLWPGQSDEKELGLTYARADQLLYYLVDKKYSLKRLMHLGFRKGYIEKVKCRIAANAFKSKLPAIAKI
ncbi:MAG: NAD+ synthase [Candidatus Omnitrophica bacterium]|nr:NAD+ synthase [Candidatus Omnitrophota bacterium]